MNQDLGLRILSEIMSWSDDRALNEFAWLRFMARLKYDGYRDFLAGARFIESLAIWLQQFDPTERETAYEFVRNKLIYISPAEMQRLVELFYHRYVEQNILSIVATKMSIPKYKVWSIDKAREEFNKLKRKTLFMGLSDGARIDILRHSNVGVLSNEQLVIATQVDQDKWEDLLSNLREDLKDRTARFELVYLVDDFLGTGTTLLRYDDDKKIWKGKLVKFSKSIKAAADAMDGRLPFQDNWKLCIHHYIASYAGSQDVINRTMDADLTGTNTIELPDIYYSFGLTLPEDIPIDANNKDNNDLLELTNKYYNPSIKTKHHEVGGVTHLGLGYGGCALPIVLEHNTPNNSFALLWAEAEESTGENGIKVPAMRPLFRRRERHS